MKLYERCGPNLTAALPSDSGERIDYHDQAQRLYGLTDEKIAEINTRYNKEKRQIRLNELYMKLHDLHPEIIEFLNLCFDKLENK